MNKFLATSVAVLNQLLAIVFILIGSLIGFKEGLGALGGILGFLVAVVICGTLALLIDIRNELTHIRRALRNQDTA